MDRALRGDDAQLLDLLLGAAIRESENELEVGQAAPVGRGVLALDLDRADVPALALGVHLHRDRGTRGQTGGQELLRARALVGSAVFGRLISGQLMLADVDAMADCSPCG